MIGEVYEPKGVRFFDGHRGEMLLVDESGHPFDGWLCYRHPDGQWVSLRKATPRDLESIGICQKAAP